MPALADTTSEEEEDPDDEKDEETDEDSDEDSVMPRLWHKRAQTRCKQHKMERRKSTKNQCSGRTDEVDEGCEEQSSCKEKMPKQAKGEMQNGENR